MTTDQRAVLEYAADRLTDRAARVALDEGVTARVVKMHAAAGALREEAAGIERRRSPR